MRARRIPSVQRCAVAAAFACAILFPPAASMAGDTDEITIEEASGRELIALLNGNTLIVSAPGETGGAYGYLHLKEDGTAIFREMLPDASPGRIRWSVDERQRLCITETLDPGARKDCGLFRMKGDDLYIYGDNGKVEHAKARLVRGEPRE